MILQRHYYNAKILLITKEIKGGGKVKEGPVKNSFQEDGCLRSSKERGEPVKGERSI